MKRKLFTIALAVICLSTLACGTLAYFTSEDVAHNVITSSGVEIQLVETTIDPATGLEVPFPEDGIPGVMPGDTASKRVRVLNKEAESWVRVQVEKVVLSADKKKLNPDYIHLDIKPGWIEKDGYYYYTKPLAKGHTTPCLFTEVGFDGEGMDNAYQNCTIRIGISAQAVQTANNLPDNGSRELTAANVSQIDGWPSVTSFIRGLFD